MNTLKKINLRVVSSPPAPVTYIEFTTILEKLYLQSFSKQKNIKYKYKIMRISNYSDVNKYMYKVRLAILVYNS